MVMLKVYGCQRLHEREARMPAVCMSTFRGIVHVVEMHLSLGQVRMICSAKLVSPSVLEPATESDMQEIEKHRSYGLMAAHDVGKLLICPRCARRSTDLDEMVRIIERAKNQHRSEREEHSAYLQARVVLDDDKRKMNALIRSGVEEVADAKIVDLNIDWGQITLRQLIDSLTGGRMI